MLMRNGKERAVRNGRERYHKERREKMDIPKEVLFTGDIKADMLKQPELMVKYGKKHAEAFKKKLEAEFKCKYIYALTREKIRQEYENQNKKITEAKLDSLATVSPEYKDAVAKYHEAVANELYHRSILEAIKSRNTLLISLSADERLEAEITKGGEISPELIETLNKKLTEKMI